MHSWQPLWLPDGPSLILWMTQCPRNRRKNGPVRRRERKRSGGLPPRHSGRPIILREHSRSDRTLCVCVLARAEEKPEKEETSRATWILRLDVSNAWLSELTSSWKGPMNFE